MEECNESNLTDCKIDTYVAGDQITNNNYITMFQEKEREFVVTHNANIKSVSYFTGRETELQDLRQRMEDGLKSVLVSGMGGIGKTHICRKLFSEYVAMHKKKEKISFEHIGYIEYDSNIDSSLENCLKYKKQDNPKQNQEAAWRELEYLASEGTLLLFVDNVDKTIRQDSGLKRLNSIPGSMILTSRQTSISNEFEPYHIGFLEKEQCKDIYKKIRYEGGKKKVEDADREDLNYIIENLVGRHTITIEFLAKLARVKLWSVKKLRQQLENNGFKMQYHEQGDLINIQESYETLYNLSELTEGEQNILEAFSVFPYIFLPVKQCNKWLLEDAGVNEDDEIIIGLFNKGWLQFDMVQEGYALHPVFAQFIYERYKPRIERHLNLIDKCIEDLSIKLSRPILKCKMYIPFAETIIEKITVEDSGKIFYLAIKLLSILIDCMEYKKAVKLAKKIITIYKEKNVNDEYLVLCYENLAGLYKLQGEYRKAEEQYVICTQIMEVAQGKDSLFTANVYDRLASVLYAQRKFKNAEEFYKKSLHEYIGVYGENNSCVINGYSTLAELNIKQNRYDIALIYYLKTYKILNDLFGEGHEYTIVTYMEMKHAYLEMNPKGDFEQWLKEQRGFD